MDRSNKFLKLEHTQHRFAAAESVVIAGRSQTVVEIMLYKRGWIQRNYYDAYNGLRGIVYCSMLPFTKL